MFKRLILLSLSLLAILGCQSEYKSIKESELKAIIKEILFVEAYLSQNKDQVTDSVDYFSHIFDNYGYNAADFQYTIRRLGLRKSSVLGAMLDEISMQLDSLKKLYNYKGKLIENWDNSAFENRAKVVYFRDSVIFKSLKQVDTCATIKIPLQWTGTYAISYKYSVDSISNVGPYSLEYGVLDTLTGSEYNDGRYWMVNNQTMKSVTSTMDVDTYNQNMLVYTLPRVTKEEGKIIFRVDSLKVVYLPQEDVIDLEYLGQKTGGDRLPYIGSYYRPYRGSSPPLIMASDSVLMEYSIMIDSITQSVRMELPVPYINDKNINIYEKDMRSKSAPSWKSKPKSPLAAGR